MKLKIWVRHLGWMAAALLALGQPQALTAREPAPAAAAAETARPAASTLPRPAIWLLEDEDTKIYLFGTVHVFSERLEWRSEELDRIIAEADELVMETPDAAMDELPDMGRLLETMAMGKSVPILDRVSPEARPALREALEATAMPIEFYDELHTWAVAFMLAGHQMIQAHAEEEGEDVALTGAEEVLGREFQQTKRPISGVETMDEQIGIFASMPIGAQRRFLESTVMGANPLEAQPTGRTDEAWARGDVEAIATEMRTMPDELYEALLTDRNRNWTGWLVRRLERPGTVLFAVGAGHLAGSDSVQAMLAQRGLEARRID